jgi:hypothetical protein
MGSQNEKNQAVDDTQFRLMRQAWWQKCRVLSVRWRESCYFNG